MTYDDWRIFLWQIDADGNLLIIYVVDYKKFEISDREVYMFDLNSGE